MVSAQGWTHLRQQWQDCDSRVPADHRDVQVADWNALVLRHECVGTAHLPSATQERDGSQERQGAPLFRTGLICFARLCC